MLTITVKTEVEKIRREIESCAKEGKFGHNVGPIERTDISNHIFEILRQDGYDLTICSFDVSWRKSK
jgi:hypothetical protein